MDSKLFILLLVFQAKHLLADYFLQWGMMLKKFEKDPRLWIPALSVHCAVHAVMTLVIVTFFTVNPATGLALSALDFVLHFIMDRVKASPSLMGRWKPLFGQAFKMYSNMSKGLTLEGDQFRSLNPEQLAALRNEGKKVLRGNTFFWWALGIDQTFHHITHYIIIYLMLG